MHEEPDEDSGVSKYIAVPFGRGLGTRVRVTETSTGLSSPPDEVSVDLLIVRFPLSARAWTTNGGK